MCISSTNLFTNKKKEKENLIYPLIRSKLVSEEIICPSQESSFPTLAWEETLLKRSQTTAMVTAMAVACPPHLSLGFAPRVRTKIHCRRHALRASRHESGTRTLFLSCPLPCGRRVINYRSASHAEEIPAPVPASTEDDSSFSVLAAITSLHNDIVVVDTPASRFLLLDSTRRCFSCSWIFLFFLEFVV